MKYPATKIKLPTKTVLYQTLFRLLMLFPSSKKQQSDSFQVFRTIAEDLMNRYVAEGKSAKATQDHRTYHATMAQGIENVLVALSEHIEAAKQRVQAATSEDKRHLGVNVKRVINVGPSSLEEPDAEPFSDGQHTVNTLGGMKVVSATAEQRSRK